MRPKLVLCGGARSKSKLNALRLATEGPDQNVELKVSDIGDRLVAAVPPVLVDLLEIASYVYAADQATTRGGDGASVMGRNWTRNFHFVIPVRCPDRWTSSPVLESLVEALSFLSDDRYRFTFEATKSPPPVNSYFDFGDGGTGFQADVIALFSGGLDSLAGAVTELLEAKRKVALVSHSSASKLAARQTKLVEELRSRCPGGRKQLFHVPIHVHKDKSLTREDSQRTRSFLYASLAAVVGTILGGTEVHAFENGITSLNLPLAPQVVGARASRTTHPRSLSLLQAFLSKILDAPFRINNPFQSRTKADIVRTVVGGQCGDLIETSVSCSRVYEMTTMYPHCGTCSQCIDRRFGVLAAGADQYDPDHRYKVDLITGARETSEDRTMVETYVRRAIEVDSVSEADLTEHYPEIARALRHGGGAVGQNAAQFLALQRRHAQEVRDVLSAAIKRFSDQIVGGDVPPSSLVAYAAAIPRSKASEVAPRRRVLLLSEGRAILDGVEVIPRKARSLLPLLEYFVTARRGEALSDGAEPRWHGLILIQKALGRRSGAEPDEESIRTKVGRIRSTTIDRFKAATGTVLEAHELIETDPAGRGYRLNPRLQIAPV